MEDILDDLPIDAMDALENLCLRFEEKNEQIEVSCAIGDGGKVEYYYEYVTALGAYEALVAANKLLLNHDVPTLTGFHDMDIKAICDLFESGYAFSQEMKGNQKLKEHKERFLGVLGKGFTYHFNDDEVSRLQALINELRDYIRKLKQIEREHKDRLLRRLEKLQSEVHKQVSDLDRFWGMVGDAGVVAKKWGEDAKPIVDRIREVVNIVWKAQTKAESLPSDTSNPVLTDESDS